MPRLLLALPLLLLALAACADGASDSAAPGRPPGTPPASSSAPDTSPDPAPSTPASTPAGTDDAAYVGLTEQEALAKAEAEGTPVRVVSRDGESFPQTMDLREDRINLTVQGGRVTEVRRG